VAPPNLIGTDFWWEDIAPVGQVIAFGGGTALSERVVRHRSCTRRRALRPAPLGDRAIPDELRAVPESEEAVAVPSSPVLRSQTARSESRLHLGL